MSWISITVDAVLQEFTPQEQAAINGIQGAETNLAGVLARVVNGWRGSISAGGNPLGEAGTIPEQVIEDVIAEARWRWLTGMPALKPLQTGGRKDLYEDAKDRRAKIEAGSVKTEIPAEAIASTSPNNAVARPRAGRTVKTSSFDGLSTT